MRILTWNTQGSRAPEKAEEMELLIDHWVRNNDPIVIICLQEVAVDKDTIKLLLEAKGFECKDYREGWNNGRSQMIATGPQVNVLDTGRLRNLNLSEDERVLNVRIPMYCEIDLKGKHGIVYNYHAESPASLARASMLRKVSGSVARQMDDYDFVVFAGDLNTNDMDEMRLVFPGFEGMRNRYDYIMAAGMDLTNGIRSDWTRSDHVPVSVRMVI